LHSTNAVLGYSKLSVVGLDRELMHHRKEPTIRILRINQVVCELGILSINCRQLVKEFHHIRRIHHIRNLLLFLEVGWPFKKGNLQQFILKLGYHLFSMFFGDDLTQIIKGGFFHFRLEGISLNVFKNERS
jgi:hypothetical protein